MQAYHLAIWSIAFQDDVVLHKKMAENWLLYFAYCTFAQSSNQAWSNDWL